MMTWFRLLLALPGACLLPLTLTAAPPEWTALFPSGARVGSTVKVTATGTFSTWPVQVWSSTSGIQVIPQKDKGKLELTISPDTPPGTHWLRLHSSEGASSLRPFIVGSLPEVLETEPNDSHDRAQQTAELPLVVNGVLGKSGDVDVYAVSLKKGQTLVASLLASEVLASPMDAILQVLSQEGFVLDQNQDTHGLDPLVSFQAPLDGVYLVRVFAFSTPPSSSIRFSGADTHVYRLTLTTGPQVDHTFPLAVSRTSPTPVALGGWNIPGDPARVPVVAPRDEDTVTITAAGVAGAGTVALVSHPATVEQARNDREHPQEIAFPVTVSGRISEPGDVDAYAIQARKGQKLQIRVHARPASTPLDPALSVIDEKGATVARMDDVSRNQAEVDLTFSPPADGKYLLLVEDIYRTGSPRHVYRLDVLPAGADFRVSLTTDRFTLAAGKPLDIPLKIERGSGYPGEIEISAEGLPAGVSARPVKSLPTGATAKAATLQLSPEASATAGSFRIVARSRDAAGKASTVPAQAPLPGSQEGTSLLWVTPPVKSAK